MRPLASRPPAVLRPAPARDPDGGDERPTWSATAVWAGFILAFAALVVASALAVAGGAWWALVVIVPLQAFVMHSHLIAFHEASHGSLCPNRRLNDLIGTFVGVNSFMSLSLYRASHRTHHAHLNTERDEEMWPFNEPRSSRWFRRLMAGLELTVGLAYTPLLFLRTFLRPGSPVKRKDRPRVWAELALIAGFWGAVLAATAYFAAWPYLLAVYVAPAWLAGNLQSWRKYVEHMGMTHPHIGGRTRSVVPTTPLGHVLSRTLFNEPYHGVHHVYAQLPQERLPEYAEVLVTRGPADPPIYGSYLTATRDMLRTLADPKAGPQWG